jgi:uncharacterized protein YggT (Ycf19 family)
MTIPLPDLTEEGRFCRLWLMFQTRLLQGMVNIVFSFIQLILGVRVLLKFFGASIEAPFVNWVYHTSAPLLVPFEGMFPSPELSGGYIVEISALFALIAFALLGYIIDEFLDFLSGKRRDVRA